MRWIVHTKGFRMVSNLAAKMVFHKPREGKPSFAQFWIKEGGSSFSHPRFEVEQMTSV